MDANDFMNLILDPKIQEFIKTHETDDVRDFVLRNQSVFGVATALIAQQIVARQKAKSKLPELFETTNIVYPPSINLEQSSSQAPAQFKSTLFSGKSLVDLTGGFGIDCYYLSKAFNEVKYVEPNELLCGIVRHNHRILKAENIQHINSTAGEFLKTNRNRFDLCYIDPSRRNISKKVFRFSDCDPNVLLLMPELRKLSKKILIKASPLLDIQQGLRELGSVERVLILSVENECKEVLFLCDQKDKSPVITAIELDHYGTIKSQFEFKSIEELNAKVTYSGPLQFIYEPWASILKAGAFKLMSSRFGPAKIAVNTHLYTSDYLIENFPGKVFETIALIKSSKKDTDEFLPDGKANITTRNYPLSADQLKRKLKIKDGGKRYLIGFSGRNKKFLVVANRIR